MQCKCGNEITHVPEHLRELADWVCRECTNVAPRQTVVNATHGTGHKQTETGRKKAA